MKPNEADNQGVYEYTLSKVYSTNDSKDHRAAL